MSSMEHIVPPEDRSEWDRPDYLFPTYEDDGLLCRLDDEIYERPVGSPGSGDGGAPVEAEDPPVEVAGGESILRDEDFRKSITSGH